MSVDVLMVRLRIDLAYDGAFFHGWAAQPGLRTVEGELSSALATIFRRPVQITVAGRTDAGVHAQGQVAHFEISSEEWEKVGDPKSLVRRIQGLLGRSYADFLREHIVNASVLKVELASGSDLVVYSIQQVDTTFDARFSALERHYCYRLTDGLSMLVPSIRANIWWTGAAELDITAINECSNILLGEHDFLSFCRPREGATTIRTLHSLSAVRLEQDQTVAVSVSADAFCHSMVRSLVGALYEVARGKKKSSWISTLLREPGRGHNVPIAPAKGLTLESVDYPVPELWGERAKQARSVRSQCC